MFRAVLILTLLRICFGQLAGDSKDDLVSLLQEIFGQPPTTTTKDSEPECYTEKSASGRCLMHNYCTSGRAPANVAYKGTCASGQICCPLDDVSPTPVAGCGWRNKPENSVRIQSDGGRTEFGEFPWIVAVLEKLESKKVAFAYVGGGSLIHRRVVVTTAHSFSTNVSSLRVRAGEWDSSSEEEIYPYQERNIESLIVHEQYNTVRKNLFYDIALLLLRKPVEIRMNVNIACLPPNGQPTPPATRCYSSGWGKDRFDGKGQYQTIPKKVELPVVEHSACQKILRTTRLGPFFNLHQSFMCAGGEAGKDSCTGDGGSPLMCPIENQSGRYVASGMVAWGIGCGGEYPGVYVDLAFLRPWVDDKMTELGYGASSYTYTN